MGMRLGYLVPEFPSQTHIFFWREIQALRRSGEDVCLISTRKPSPIVCRHDFAPAAVAETHYLFPPSVAGLTAWVAGGGLGFSKALEYIDALDVARRRSRLRLYGLLATAIGLVQWARRERIGYIHCHSCADAAHVVSLARRAGGPPYSLTLHGDLEVYGTDHRSKMEGAAFVHTVGSHLHRQVIERVGLTHERVFVTCMGVDTSKLATLSQDRNSVRGALRLVTVARLHPAKGHVHALAAVRRAIAAGLKVHYTIVGEGPHRSALQSEVRRLELESHVTLTGTLSENEVYAQLANADVFVLPSTGMGEAWPVSIMEAMGAGLPVISSIIGATPEMITPGVDGFLVPQGDQDALLKKIVLLANDIELRRRIGATARRTACRRFDVTTTATALRDAILSRF